jgi:hypothetical protein
MNIRSFYAVQNVNAEWSNHVRQTLIISSLPVNKVTTIKLFIRGIHTMCITYLVSYRTNAPANGRLCDLLPKHIH